MQTLTHGSVQPLRGSNYALFQSGTKDHSYTAFCLLATCLQVAIAGCYLLFARSQPAIQLLALIARLQPAIQLLASYGLACSRSHCLVVTSFNSGSGVSSETQRDFPPGTYGSLPFPLFNSVEILLSQPSAHELSLAYHSP